MSNYEEWYDPRQDVLALIARKHANKAMAQLCCMLTELKKQDGRASTMLHTDSFEFLLSAMYPSFILSVARQAAKPKMCDILYLYDVLKASTSFLTVEEHELCRFFLSHEMAMTQLCPILWATSCPTPL